MLGLNLAGPLADLKTVVHDLITFTLDYHNSLLVVLPASSLQKMHLVQNAAAWVSSGTFRNEHILHQSCSPSLAPCFIMKQLQSSPFNLSNPWQCEDLIMAMIFLKHRSICLGLLGPHPEVCWASLSADEAIWRLGYAVLDYWLSICINQVFGAVCYVWSVSFFSFSNLLLYCGTVCQSFSANSFFIFSILHQCNWDHSLAHRIWVSVDAVR